MLMMKRTGRLIAFTAVIAFAIFAATFIIGCEDPGSYGEVEPTVLGRVAVTNSTSAPPADNPRHEIWKTAMTGAIMTSDSAFSDNPEDIDSIPIFIKAIKTGSTLYLRAEWGENVEVVRRTYSIWPNPIVHRLSVDTTGDTVVNVWLRRPSVDTTDTIRNDQDRLAVMWDAGDNGAEGADCRSMCHDPANPSPSGNRMYTTGGGHVDVWHWMAATTDPVLLAQDEYWSAYGRGADEGTVSIFEANFDTLASLPRWMNKDTTKPYIPFLHADMTVAFDAARKWYNLDSIAGYVVHDDAAGSVADVASYSMLNLSNRRWMVLMSRKLTTGNPDDRDFASIAPGDSILVTVAFMDNADRVHYGSRPFYVVFPK